MVRSREITGKHNLYSNTLTFNLQNFTLFQQGGFLAQGTPHKTLRPPNLKKLTLTIK
jgi:hypothetical protein